MAPVIKAEITLVSLKNCLVNLPPNLIALLANSNTAPQDVIVELQYKVPNPSSSSVTNTNNVSLSNSAYVGWTGMPSRSRPASLLTERSRGGRELEVQAVEIDGLFAKVLGLAEGQKVGLLVHLNPPIANTINIEPVTSADWEAIELHANFLELNMLNQVRALPNPLFRDPAHPHVESNQHPLTLHLSPSTIANILVTSMSPMIAASIPFAKIAPDSEVIVAPKTRQRPTRTAKGDTRSVASQRSKRSGASGRNGGSRKLSTPRSSILLRGVDASVGGAFLHTDDDENTSGLRIWMSKVNVMSDAIRGASFASVSVVKPAGLRAQLDQTQMERLKEEDHSEVGRPAGKIVARVSAWTNPLDDNHVMLSPALATMLAVSEMAGLLLRIEGVDAPLSRYSLKSLIFFPFVLSTSKKNESLKFGGDSRAQRQAMVDRLRITHGGDAGLLSGPLTDGMILPPAGDPSSSSSFSGGILRLQKSEDAEQSASDQLRWALGGEHKQDFEVREEVPRPLGLATLFPTFVHNIPSTEVKLIGVDGIYKQCMSNLTLCSSTLLTGGIGSGKTAIAQSLGTRMREDYLFNVTFFSCQKLVTDETRVSTIKETLTRLFMSASWCARLGGQSVIILDDVDKLCPVETELQVGNDNGRSRQVTEIICSLVRQYCGINSGVAMLATAQSKDNLNSIIIGGHIVGDIVSIKSPSKETRRDVLAHLLSVNRGESHTVEGGGQSYAPSDLQSMSNNSWMNPADASPRPGSSSSSHLDGFRASPSLDLLDVAGKTDGYMPADLHLLVSRARNQCLIRTVSATQDHDPDQSPALILIKADFETALENFTPTSLRNVTLTHSTTTFSAIGGLKSTRDTLLETLLYPTKYAPIFAASPLRLRSGLLLYGYPGCGKTLLASAVAGECGLNFISVKGPEILNKYIGASEKSVRDLFERAQAAKPCVLFFDEFDSIAPKRGHDSTGVTDRVVNQMLTQMDGAEGLDGVYVLAATSRPDLIDPALLRPGRLDKSLLCDMPSATDREDILRTVSEKLNLASSVAHRLEDIAASTEGFSGADLQALMYNAHLEAIHDLLGDQSPSSSNQNNRPPTPNRSTQQPPSSTRSSSVSSTTSTSTSTSGSSHRSSGTVNGTATSTSTSTPTMRPPSRSSSSLSSSSLSSRKSPHKSSEDFIQFIYSPSLDAAARNAIGTPPSGAKLDSRAEVAAKLEEMKLNRRREKALLRPPPPPSLSSNVRSAYDQDAIENGRQSPTAANGADSLRSSKSRQRKGGAATGGGAGGEGKGGGEEVVIQWKHVVKSLGSTRASISAQERKRLEAIYREFVVGRNGEMPSGEGGREVGGRSSLM